MSKISADTASVYKTFNQFSIQKKGQKLIFAPFLIQFNFQLKIEKEQLKIDSIFNFQFLKKKLKIEQILIFHLRL